MVSPTLAEFVSESLYAEEHWYVHELLEVDAEQGAIVALTDTTKLGGSVEAQRPWPGQPKHVPGNVMIQMTGTLGNLHAVFVLGLRMTEGWVGFGVGIDEARFRNIARIGPPLRARAQQTRVRRIGGRVFVSYEFEFTQEGALVFESRQTAVWARHE